MLTQDKHYLLQGTAIFDKVIQITEKNVFTVDSFLTDLALTVA